MRPLGLHVLDVLREVLEFVPGGPKHHNPAKIAKMGPVLQTFRDPTYLGHLWLVSVAIIASFALEFHQKTLNEHEFDQNP